MTSKIVKLLAESGDDFTLGLAGNSTQSDEVPRNGTDTDHETTEYFNIVDDNEEDTTEIETTTKKSKKKRKLKVKRDITAAEFYAGIKETMGLAGYHDDCLLKSVCELAKHPLIEHDDNLVYEIIHFILTPSLHQAFDPETEENGKKIYEEAEEIGKSGGDCDLVYGTCESSPLHSISNYITEEIYD